MKKFFSILICFIMLVSTLAFTTGCEEKEGNQLDKEDFHFCISLEKTTFLESEDIYIDFTLINLSGKDVEILGGRIFLVDVPTASTILVVDPPHPSTLPTIVIEKEKSISERHMLSEYVELEEGEHELTARVVLHINAGSKNEETISIESKIVLLTVKEA